MRIIHGSTHAGSSTVSLRSVRAIPVLWSALAQDLTVTASLKCRALPKRRMTAEESGLHITTLSKMTKQYDKFRLESIKGFSIGERKNNAFFGLTFIV